MQAQAKLERDDRAKSVAHIIEGRGWLLELLITPMAAGALSVTPEGEAAIGPLRRSEVGARPIAMAMGRVFEQDDPRWQYRTTRV